MADWNPVLGTEVPTETELWSPAGGWCLNHSGGWCLNHSVRYLRALSMQLGKSGDGDADFALYASSGSCIAFFHQGAISWCTHRSPGLLGSLRTLLGAAAKDSGVWELHVQQPQHLPRIHRRVFPSLWGGSNPHFISRRVSDLASSTLSFPGSPDPLRSCDFE